MAQPHGNSNTWYIGHVADASLTNHELKAAPGTGLAFYITDIVHIQGTTGAVIATLLDGSGGGTLTKTAPGASLSQTVNLQTPIKLTSNTALDLNVSGTSTNGFIVICGFTSRG
jgi:hypothetical protein